MDDDRTLLLRFADLHDQTAFTGFVQRHLALVYSAALRRVGADTHRAWDVVQTVFVRAAKHARSLATHPAPVAWLHSATRTAAIDTIRRDVARRSAEHTAAEAQMIAGSSSADWDRVRSMLDAAIDALGERDRTAILLRFFEQRSFAEIAAVLGVNEDAARIRCHRALDRLRANLVRSGCTSSAAALGTALAQNGVAAVPAGLQPAVIAAAAGATPLPAAVSILSAANASTLLAIAAAAAAIALGVRQVHIAQTNVSAVAGLQAEVAALTTSVRTLKADVRPPAPLTPRLSPVPSASAAPTMAQSTAVAPNDGARFLAETPEARAALEAVQHRIFAQLWGEPLTWMNLTADERIAIERQIWSIVPWSFVIRDNGWSFLPGTKPEQVQATGAAVAQALLDALGPTRFGEYRETFARAPVYEVVQAMAAAACEAGEPLSNAQAAALIEAILTHGARRSPVVSGSILPTVELARWSVGTVDWPSVLHAVAGQLTPVQIAATEAARRSQSAHAQQQQARRVTSAGGPQR